MKQFYITLLLVLIGMTAFAQKDFRPGYLVQNDETLTGLVDYRGALRNASVVTFKASESAEEQAFGPEQVQGFGFEKENKLYESKLIPAFDSLNAPKTLFAEVLVKGQANLYFLRDPMQKDRFYIAKGSAALQELRVEEFKRIDEKTGRDYAMRRELYKPILLQNFLDCQTITEAAINKVVIGHNSLKAIVQEYNRCMGREEYTKPYQSVHVGVGVVAGVSSSTLSYSIQDTDQNFDNTSVKPMAGAFLNIMIPTFSAKVSFQAELLYVPNYFEGKTEDDPTIPGITTSENYIDMKHLKVPVLVRYTFPRGLIRPFFNVGPVWSFAISQESQANRTTTMGGTTRTSTVAILEDDEFRRLTTGITAGAGISYNLFNKPVMLEARYEKNRGITNLKGQTSSIESISLLLSYKL